MAMNPPPLPPLLRDRKRFKAEVDYEWELLFKATSPHGIEEVSNKKLALAGSLTILCLGVVAFLGWLWWTLPQG